jgi:UDP-glucose 4-epimerase
VKHVLWVIGNGLLGGGIRRVVRAEDDWIAIEATPLPWFAPDEIAGIVSANLATLLTASADDDADWSIVWAAGSSTVASEENETASDVAKFTVVLRTIRDIIGNNCRGSFFLASSVGGVYAGAPNPPFTELTAIAPTSPYGHLKARTEALATEFSEQAGISVLIGRITNLYGPGQRLDKSQGLISHLLLSRYGDTPASVFVSLETIRDYFYVDDCARLILAALVELGRQESRPVVVTKILGSGQGVSISSLLGHLRYITKTPPSVSIGRRASSKFQAPDLRVSSVIWPHLDRREKTSIAAGIHATMIDLLKALQR